MAAAWGWGECCSKAEKFPAAFSGRHFQTWLPSLWWQYCQLKPIYRSVKFWEWLFVNHLYSSFLIIMLSLRFYTCISKTKIFQMLVESCFECHALHRISTVQCYLIKYIISLIFTQIKCAVCLCLSPPRPQKTGKGIYIFQRHIVRQFA